MIYSGTDLARYNSFASEAQAIEYDESNVVKPFDHGYTGGEEEIAVTSIADINAAIELANSNPDKLYILTYDQRTPITISGTVTLETSGHIKLLRKQGNSGGTISNNDGFMFYVPSGATLNIGSANMTGTIELDGGAVWVLASNEPNMDYDFERDRAHDNGNNGVRNNKVVNNVQYVLFNDGEDYSVAHWYKNTGVDSTAGLISVNSGTLNIYSNTRIGNVFASATIADKYCGTIFNNGAGKVNMHGGEISWNSMGVQQNSVGTAIFSKSTNGVVTINDGLIAYNTARDNKPTVTDTNNNRACGGAIGIDGGKLYINGGAISNCRSATGDGANGGGVCGREGARIYMNGGEISNNLAGHNGGGIVLWKASCYLNGGTITRNFAINGGGIAATSDGTGTPNGCEIVLQGKTVISENYAEVGGGIVVGAPNSSKRRGINCKLEMLNGEIINNYATKQGGGVCDVNDQNSAITLRGGTISHNKAGVGGAGVAIFNTGSSRDPLLYLEGGIIVNTNNDVYISALNWDTVSGKTVYQTPIRVTGRLESAGTIGMISMDDYSTYVGENIVLDVVKFQREDGGTLEVQENKFAIDTDEYILKEEIANNSLRLYHNTTADTNSYVARIGEKVYTNLKQAIETYAQNGDTIYIIKNITMTETINVNKNIKIVAETANTKNDDNILDKNLKKANGTLITPSNQSSLNFRYYPTGDYTISLASSFGDNSNNTSGFIVKNGGSLSFGSEQYDEADISVLKGGFLGLDGNSGHEINGSLVEVQNGGTFNANAGVTIGNNSTNNGLVGAGVNVLSGGQFTLNGASIKYNQTTTDGAGVYVAGNMTMINGHIDENEAQNGAGIYVANGGTVVISNGSINANDASNDGAGIYIAGGATVTFENGEINNNDADNDGGGIYVGADAIFTMNAGSFNNNRTIKGDGAAIYLDGDAYISGGSFNGNNISSYNSDPKGRGILVNVGSELHISKDIYLDSRNPVYLTSGELIYVDDALTMSHAIPMNSELTAPQTRIAKINTNDATRAREIETATLYNKSIYEIKYNKDIIGERTNNEYYLIYDAVTVNYDGNNAKSGDGVLPVDETFYSGGDTINILPQVSGDPITRDGYVFIGWSPVQVNPITTAADELKVDIYYPTDLIPGVIYNRQYTIYEVTAFYAVWSVDANHNGQPDYRENVLDITIAPSENGSMTSSLNQAQGGMFVLLTAIPFDGYEVDTIEVKYTLNGVEGTYSLNNNKVIKLDEKLFYFYMPLANATIYTTFKVQTINEVKITWNDGSEEEWGTLQSAINEVENNTSKQGKKISLLKYVYSKIETDIPEGVNIELDLNGHTLDMNHLPFVIYEGATLKISDSMTGGKISFNSTGGSNNVANNLVNNGTLNITGGAISMEAGADSTQNLIQNNGTLTVSGGSIKHNDENGIAIYNDGTATLTGGNINGGKYGIYQASTINNSLDISGYGPINTYGINQDNFISSVYVAKNTFINVSGVINNCSGDNSVSAENKIPLYIDETIDVNEPIIKSDKVDTMVKHFRTHFSLANRPKNMIAVTPSNEAVLIAKPYGTVVTSGDRPSYPYRSTMTVTAQLLDVDRNPYVGATGTVYFFLFKGTSDWHQVWRNEEVRWGDKKVTSGDTQIIVGQYGPQDADGVARVDSTTGIATCEIPSEEFDTGLYYIFAIYFGDGTYDTFSLDGLSTSGYESPLYAKTKYIDADHDNLEVPQGKVAISKKRMDDPSISVTPINPRKYNGKDQSGDIEIEVYDGEMLLVEGVDYEVNMPIIKDVGTYNIIITGKGKYDENTNTSVSVEVQKYNGQIHIQKFNGETYIDGLGLRYNAGSIPNIDFSSAQANARVVDSYGNPALVYGTDYSIKYYKMDTTTEQYVEIPSLESTAGVYKVVATCLASSTDYEEGLTAEAAFVISSDGSQFEAIVENQNSLVFNGRERTISELGEIEVTGKVSETAPEVTLVRDVDYTVMFGTSSVKNARTYPLIIQGKGEYAELVNLAVDITINKKVVTKDNTTITFSDDDLVYEYNGKAIIPSIQNIEIDGVDTSSATGTPLVAGTDYITSVSGDNVRVSASDPAFDFITLNGNYATATLVYPFHINPRSLANNNDVTVSIYQSGFTGNEIVPTVTILDRVGGVSKKLTEDDYTVTYRVSDVENNTATLSNGYPLSKGTYDAIITGKGNYQDQKIETFEVGNYRGRIIATLDPSEFTYTGNDSAIHGSIVSALTVTRGDDATAELEYGTDYTLGYGSPENTVAPSEVGEYLLYVVGTGNYNGVHATTTYKISPLTGTINIELSENSLTYNGKIQRPELNKSTSYMLVEGSKVYLNSLEEGRDYAVIVDENSKDVGGYILQVNGIGRYAGNYNFASYQITPRPINDAAITIKSATSTDREYNGQAQTLVFSPSGDAWLEYKYDVNENPIILQENRDFTVVHSNNTNGGIAVAVIAGIGNFGGLTTYTFVIESKPINSGDNVADGFTLTGVEDKDYTGSACMQDLVLTDTVFNKVLVEGTDYTVTYQNNYEVGTASYKIEAKGNYKGTIRGTFEINPTNISSANVIVSNDNAVYNTISQRPEVSVSIARNGTTVQLHEGVDFEIVLGENQFINVGTYDFTIKGKAGSNYTGTKEVQFTIVPYTGALNVSLKHDRYNNGITKEEIENDLVITYGTDTLSGDKFDITYTPDGNLTTGNYVIKVDAKNSLPNYYESASSRANGTAFFTIEGLEDITLSLRESSRVYTAGTIVIPESDMIINSGESVSELREDPANRDLTYVVSWDRPIKDVGTYTLTVRILKGNNELQSASTTFEVLAKDINAVDVIADEIEDQFYTGASLKPDFRLEYNEEVLSTNDYTAVYSNNKNVGEATITLVGKGNYVGTRELPFEIIRESQGDIIITLTESGEEVTNTTYIYNGLAKTPNVSVDYVVEVGERVTLVEGRDYRVAFENNVNSGTAKAIVTLCGNYEGSEDKEFKINKYNLSIANVVLEDSTVYNGRVQKPQIEVRRDNTLLELDKDYEVSYDGSFIDANTYSVILIRALSGDNCNYNGEQQITYTINPYGNNSGEKLLLDFVDDKASFKDGTIADTNAFKDLLIVKDLNGNTLPNSNYTVEYTKAGNTVTFPQGVGVYTVKVTGTGVNYAGHYDIATRDFVIYLRTANVSDTTATYKNANFNISEIINSIVITSEEDSTVVLNKNNFDISFGSTVPRSIGTYTVIVIGKEGTDYEGILGTGSFTVTPAQIVFSSVTDREYCGHSHEPEMTIAGVGGEDLLYKKDYIIKYSGDSYATTEVPPTDVGNYKVTVEGLGNYQGKVTLPYEITPVDLADDRVAVELVNNDQVYNTTKQEPSINVTYISGHGAKRLVLGEDFELVSGDNGYINADTYNVTIRAVTGSNYVGNKSFEYTIKPYVGLLNVSLSGDAEYTNGVSKEAVLADLIVTYGNDVLSSSDYDVEFSSDVLTPGVHTINVTAKDSNTNYSNGTESANGNVQFTVDPASDITVTISGDTCVFTAQTIVLSDENILIDGVSVHDLRESNNGLTYEITGINGIKDVGTYPITVRVLKGNNELQKAIANFTVTKKNIADDDIYTRPVADQYYTGLKIQPEFLLSQNGIVLDQDDFEAVYADNTNVGEATITVVGKGNYEGTKEIKFNIVEASGNVIITLTQDGNPVTDNTYTYDGTAKTPDVSVAFVVGSQSIPLEEGIDYRVSYEDNIESTSQTVRAKAVVTLCGNYSGREVKEFRIGRYNLANATVTLSDTAVYNGSVQKPAIEVKRDNVILELGTNYILTYNGTFVDAGTYEVVINAPENNNYTGEKVVEYTIDKYGKNDNEILILEFADDKTVFNETITKQVFESKLSVKDINGNTLSDGNYTVTYSADGTTFTNNFPTEIGSYVVKVTGTGTNYAGQHDVSTRYFVISVNALDVSNSEAIYKNAAYKIDEIIDQIEISSVGGVIDNDNFDIRFGRSTPKNVGAYTVIVTGKDNTEYAGVYSAGEFNIKPASIVVGNIEDVDYSGISVAPSIEISGVGGENVVIEKDYTITYSGESYNSKIAPTKVGNYDAIVTGKGNYTGTVVKHYSVNPIVLNNENINVEVSNNNTIYNTDIQNPIVYVTYETTNGFIKLKSDDYELVHGDNVYKNADTYDFTIKAKNDSNYAGTKEATYTIKPYVGSINVTVNESYVNGISKEDIIDDLVVKYLDEELDKTKLDIVFTPYTLTTGHYTIEVKAKDSLTNYYESEDSRANGYALFTITGASNIDIYLEESTSVYSADEVVITKDDVIISGDGTVAAAELAHPDLDYELEISDTIKNVGTYTVTLKVLREGNVLQKASTTYTVTPKDIGANDVVANNIADQTYTGNEIEPAFTLTYNNVGLTPSDYTAFYKDNKDVGTATIMLAGKGNFEGTKEITFTIKPEASGDVIITLKENGEAVTNSTYTYNGTAKTPDVIVEYVVSGERRTLSENSDYTVAYESNVDSGIAKAIVTLCGNYSGVEEAEFKINEFDLSDATMTLSENKVYNGAEQRPQVTVQRGDVLLVEDRDYDVSYSGDFVNASTYNVKITAVANSNYQGNNSKNFTISKYGLNNGEILLLEFANGKASYVESTTKAQFESNLVVKDLNGNTLANNTYVVTYSEDGTNYTSTYPTGAGTYTVKVTGTGTNYAGQNDIATREFVIYVNTVTVTDAEATYKNAVFTINDILDQITITSDANTVIANSNFDITFGSTEPKNVGTYTILVTGKADTDFANVTATGEFTINPATLTVANIANVEYTGKTTTPVIAVSGVEGENLVIIKDYTITYSGDNYNSNVAPTNVGTYQAIVSGIGNYTGTQTKEFSVTPISFAGNNIEVVVTNNNPVYNRAEQKPEITVSYVTSDGTITLVSGEDYTVDNGTNGYTNAGSYTVTINAKVGSNYVDSKEVTYTIKPFVGTLNVTLSGDPYTNGVTKEEIINSLTVKYGDEELDVSKLNIAITPRELTTGNYTLEVNTKSELTNYFESNTSRASGYVLFTINGANEIEIRLDESESVYTAHEIEITKADVIVSGDNKTVEELEADNQDLTYDLVINTIKDVGTYTITLKVSKDGNLLQQASTTFTVTPKDISGDDVIASEIEDQLYSGEELEPAFTLTYSGEVLVSGEDYTYVYKNNKEEGTASIIVEGKGNYKGTRTLEFNIVNDLDNVTVTIEDATYNGGVQEPTIVVKRGNLVLEEGTDYTVNHGTNVYRDAGEYEITIEPAAGASYQGTKEATYTIKPYVGQLEVSLSGDPYTNGITKQEILDNLTVRYSGEELDIAKLEITFTPDEITIGNYTLEVKATDELTNFFESGDSRANGYTTFTIIDASDITISLDESSHVYTGDEVVVGKADVKVDGDKTVSELETEHDDLDYELITSGTILNVGKYTITLKISKNGNLLQQASCNYEITKKDLADSDVSLSGDIADQTYTGEEIEPSFTLKYNGHVLTNDDYSTIYKNNVNAGTASIVLQGIGNFKGSKTITFNIVAEQGEPTIKLYEGNTEVSEDTYTYDGIAKTPTVKVFVGATELNEGIDYNVSYENNVNSGTAKAKATLKGNYSGTKEAEFTINKVDLDDVEIKLSSNVTYNGSVQKPSVEVTYGSILLTEDTDYEVAFDGEFKNAGSYAVTITAINDSNYAGSVEKQFTINKYGTIAKEILLLEFANGKTSYNEDITKAEFEQNLLVKDINGNTLSSDDFVISYDDEFTTAVGTYTVTVTGTGTNYAGSNDKASRTYVICVDSLNINNVEKPFKNAVYTINEISGDIVVKSDVGTELPKDSFDMSFGESNPKSAGKYTIIVSGKAGSDYEGTLGTAEFEITALDTFTVEDVDDIDYTGTTSKPDITVNGVNDSILEEGKDYTVTYTGTDYEGNEYSSTTPPTKVGEYTAIITGIGNYEGATDTKAFSIDPIENSDIDATLVPEEFVYNESNQVPVEVVKYISTDSTIMLVSGTDYDVVYETVSGDSIAKADIIEVGNYKAIITLKGNYSGTISLDFSILEKDINSLNISIVDNSKEYNKEPQEIELIVKDPKGNELVEGTDYIVTYYKDASLTMLTDEEDGATGEGKAPANSGKYYVKVAGLGDYDEVESSATFVITKKSIDDLVIEEVDEQLYDETAKEPAITIKDGVTEVSSDDYEVTYSNNIEIGENTASATITMKDSSNYKGSMTVYFSIVVNPDEETTIELTDGSDVTYVYDGNEKKPSVVIKRDNRILEEGKDYTLSYKNNKNVGTATVTATLKGDYTGTVSTTFEITPLDIADAIVAAKPEKSNYTGKEIKPEISVRIKTDDGKQIELKDSDYNVVYPETSKNVGTYKVTINAISDNYTGTVTGTYYIIKEKGGSGGGGGTHYVEVEKIVEVPVSGDTKEEKVSTSLLDTTNHNSYITGYEDGTFKPDKIMTRAEVVTIFARLLKTKPKIEDENIFTDIDGHWAKSDIITMSKLGIVKGYEDGTFKPENKITRAEFATMITRFDEMQKLNIETSFVDVTKDHWAYETINYARIMGWISGYEDGTFRPNNSIKRAEAITIINRMLGRIGDIQTINSNKTFNKFTDIDGHWAYYGIVEATSSHEYEFDGDIEIWK